MRNIMHPTPLHNRSAGLLVVLCLSLLLACGGEEAPEPARETAAAPPPAVEEVPGLRVVGASLDAWLNLTARVESGETLRETDCEALLALPGYQALYGPEAASSLDPVVLKTVLEHVFSPRAGGRTPKRVDLITNYEYLSSRRGLAADFTTRFAKKSFRETLLGLAERFVGDALPEELVLHPVAATTSIAFLPPADLALDAGLAYAAGPDLAARLCASRVYDALVPLEGVEPHATSNGTLAMAATFRKLQHQAVFAWIVGTPSPTFDYRHPGLGEEGIRDMEFAERAVRLATRLQTMLQGQLGESGAALRADHGGDIDKLLRLHNGYEILGWAMADLIERHAGVEALAAADTPAAFLQAYQDAALNSTTALPAFEAEQLEQLIELVLEY